MGKNRKCCNASSDDRIPCCDVKQNCCVAVNPDKYLVAEGPTPLRLCPPTRSTQEIYKI